MINIRMKNYVNIAYKMDILKKIIEFKKGRINGDFCR